MSNDTGWYSRIFRIYVGYFCYVCNRGNVVCTFILQSFNYSVVETSMYFAGCLDWINFNIQNFNAR